jgi:glycosyltransferase involved in cell wall biosynthesis
MTLAATIIIPLRRQRDAWLEQCVLSAVGQSASCETLVVRAADAPPSNLALLERLAQEWGNLRVIVEEQPGSFPAAINLGIRHARAERIGLLLSDDWLDREAVAHCLPIDADIVCTRHTVYHADGVTVLQGASKTLTMRDYLNLPTLEAKAKYLEHFFFFRKAALSEAGGLDETIGNFPGIDDYDLIWTLLERGASVAIVEHRLYNYRDHDGERLTLADPAQAARNLEKILRKHGMGESEIPAMVRKASRWFGKPYYKVLAAEPDQGFVATPAGRGWRRPID